MHESEILNTAEHAVMNKLTDWPAFKWWVNDALKTRETTISAVKSGYWSRKEKFGIPLPKSVTEAYRLDDEDAKKGLPRLWKPAIDKEMTAVMIAVEFVGKNKPEESDHNLFQQFIGILNCSPLSLPGSSPGWTSSGSSPCVLFSETNKQSFDSF